MRVSVYRLYIFIYIRHSKTHFFSNWVESLFFQVFNPFFIHIMILNQWGLDFPNIFWNGVERLEFYCFFQRFVRRFWSWKTNASGCLFNASGYAFTASGCFFQHSNTLVTAVWFLWFLAPLELVFPKFLSNGVFKIRFNKFSSVLFVVSRAGRWTHPDAPSVHPDTPSQHPDASFRIRIPSFSRIGFCDFLCDFKFKPCWFVV